MNHESNPSDANPGALNQNREKGAAGWKLAVLAIAVVIGGVSIRSCVIKVNEAKARANAIGCRSNLGNLALGARIFATDHEGRYPSSWSDLSNSFGSGIILICPVHRASRDAQPISFAEAIPSSTYKYEAQSAMEGEPGRVVTYCPFHGNILLTEGEVLELMRPLTDADFDVREGKKYVKVR